MMLTAMHMAMAMVKARVFEMLMLVMVMPMVVVMVVVMIGMIVMMVMVMVRLRPSWAYLGPARILDRGCSGGSPGPLWGPDPREGWLQRLPWGSLGLGSSTGVAPEAPWDPLRPLIPDRGARCGNQWGLRRPPLGPESVVGVLASDIWETPGRW